MQKAEDEGWHVDLEVLPGRVTRSLGWKFIACYKITGGHTTLIAQNQTLGSHASSLIQRV